LLKIGMGYDIHRLEEGRKLVLGGVEIPHTRGLAGHSDGDVLIHAIIDALLGACTQGDIGQHFPDDDPKYKDIASVELLSQIRGLVAKMGRIEHIDCTVVAEAPKLAPHIEDVRRKLGEVLELTDDKISVKAKTAEGLGPVGEGKAIEAYAVALVDL